MSWQFRCWRQQRLSDIPSHPHARTSALHCLSDLTRWPFDEIGRRSTHVLWIVAVYLNWMADSSQVANISAAFLPFARSINAPKGCAYIPIQVCYATAHTFSTLNFPSHSMLFDFEISGAFPYPSHNRPDAVFLHDNTCLWI